ncbi:MAG: radical SAM protein [Candidatus Methanomethylicaceae archaeon]
MPGLVYTFNPYWGCQHGCLYCYVPDLMRRLMPALTWGRDIFVKDRVLELLKLELRRKPPGVVGVSTATDPYQPVEKKLEVTRKALMMVSGAGFPVSLQTKSPLVLRDIDIIKGKKFDVGFTITSTDRFFQKIFEPGAPPPEERISALEAISSLGINTWIFYGPIIPGHNDSEDEMENIVRLAVKTNSKIIYDRLNLKPTVVQRLKMAIGEKELMHKYSASVAFTRLEALCKKHNVRCEFAFP